MVLRLHQHNIGYTADGYKLLHITVCSIGVSKHRAYHTDRTLPVAVRKILHGRMQAVHVIHKRTEVTQDHIAAVLTDTAERIMIILL